MQSSFSALEFAARKKRRRRERFLREIDTVTPWAELAARIEPFFSKGIGRSRPRIGLARMLRMYVVQQRLGLSDEGIEDAAYDGQAIRGFTGSDLAREFAPDATTLPKFRRLLETFDLTRAIFDAINAHLAGQSLLLREGSVVDATIVSAPNSTKTDSGTRDPEMQQAKKGKNRFGLKKVRDRGLTRNSARLFTLFGLASLLIPKRQLFDLRARGAS